MDEKIIEGVCTLLFAIFAFYFLPYDAQSAKFLNAEEKQLAFYRIQVDSSSVVGEKFVLKDALQIFKHPTSWMILGSFFNPLAVLVLTIRQASKFVLVCHCSRSHSTCQLLSNAWGTPRSRPISIQ